MVDRILQWDHESYKSKYNSLYPIDQSNLIYKDRRIESFEKSEVQLPQQIFELKKSGFVLDQAAKLSIAEKWRLLIIDRLAQIEEIEKRSIEYKGGRTMLAEKKACISPH